MFLFFIFFLTEYFLQCCPKLLLPTSFISCNYTTTYNLLSLMLMVIVKCIKVYRLQAPKWLNQVHWNISIWSYSFIHLNTNNLHLQRLLLAFKCVQFYTSSPLQCSQFLQLTKSNMISRTMSIFFVLPFWHRFLLVTTTMKTCLICQNSTNKYCNNIKYAKCMFYLSGISVWIFTSWIV